MKLNTLPINHLRAEDIGQFCFYMGTFFLASALPISGLFYLIAIIISCFITKSTILKDKWSISLFIISGLLIANTIRFNLIRLDDNLSSFDRSSSWLGLFNWLPLFLIFIFFQTYLKNKKQRYLFAKLLISGSVPVLISCALQYWFNIYGPKEYLGGLIVWFNKPLLPGDGVSGLFSNQNYTGFWLSATMPLLVGITLKFKKINSKKIILFFIYLLSIYFLFLTGSRNAISSFLISSLLIFGIKKIIGIIFLIILILFLLNAFNLYSILPLSIINLNNRLLTLKNLIFSFNKEKLMILINTNRVNLWINSIKLIIEKPIFGYGAATFPFYFKQLNIQHTHNIPIQIAYEYGILISLLLTTFVGFLFYKSYLKIYNSEKDGSLNFLDKCWLISFLIIIMNHITDITYFDGKISIFIWVLLAGVKAINDEKKKYIISKT